MQSDDSDSLCRLGSKFFQSDLVDNIWEIKMQYFLKQIQLAISEKVKLQ